MVQTMEVLSVRVGRFLRSKGFDLATYDGMFVRKLENVSVLGVLSKDTDAKVTFLFGLMELPRRRFLGSLWFEDEERRAKKKRWVFEALGRKQSKLVKQLAEEMIATFKVNVIVRLVQEEPAYERFLSDFD